uniref:exostosin-like 3 isoform X1 n=1 Tax=Ciona intestinalis TaxID=7719 RepID=UPI000180C71B|nr:exostosin-like 3 isoform X1 [Ciona intestinalis]|eukprot:XP_002121020.1 exostosin-like 3 isoform X1 [Ciona intestinalis]
MVLNHNKDLSWMKIAGANISTSCSNVGREFKRFLVSAKPSRLAFIFILILLLFHFITSHLNSQLGQLYSKTDSSPDTSYRLRDLKHIDELKRIKRSISNELRNLESKRNRMQDEILLQQERHMSFEQTVKKAEAEVELLKRRIIQLKTEQKEVEKPKMAAPARLLASEESNIVLTPPTMHYKCQMHNCFDYSRCSLTSQFPVYVYSENTGNSPFDVTSFVKESTRDAFSASHYLTNDPNTACLYIAVLGEVETIAGANAKPGISTDSISNWFRSLAYWRGDGRNHLLVYFSHHSTIQNPLLGANTGRAIVAQTNFERNQFRTSFDIVVPFLPSVRTTIPPLPRDAESDFENKDFTNYDQKLEDVLPHMIPAMREYTLSFQGQWATDYNQEADDGLPPRTDSEFHPLLMENINLMTESKIHGTFFLQTQCSEERFVTPGYSSEWSLCGTASDRLSVLSRSTFVLLLPAEDHSVLLSTSIFMTRLSEALQSGAIPVILGTHVLMPLHEFISWEKAAIILPQARVTELPFLLSNIPHPEVISLRRQGRFLYETYLSSQAQVVESLLAVVRTRLQIPPIPVADVMSDVVPHSSYPVENHEVSPGDAETEFGMPPVEEATSSPRFTRNYTSVTLDSHEMWNKIPGPFHLYPFTPNDRLLPTDAQFIGSSNGFRPIGGGEGGTGKVYQESLGGNSQWEQFTIVMLTYKREEVLLQAVERLIGLPHLNKIVVVWNSPEPPGPELHWPDIGASVVVVHPEKNSLNNRFVPWSEVETEAVLSIDDDAHLRHDEILFGFRVWRESRDRVVGFPGRFHAWDPRSGGWAYNSNHTCELSMVLTGAAFFHKYYMYLYTNWMPAAVRAIVDEYMNCEDIAMNFLVSHITRKPPVKVTSRWTFRCPGCPVALSQSQEHFEERHRCINQFVKIFGYMPLVYTQFRVDSILFKTRLPHDKQKCFKFI